jgi:hypothetical protein
MKICGKCVSTRFRCSHLRPTDFLWLLTLCLPVRCRDCQERAYTNVFTAWSIRRDERIRHSWRTSNNA